MQGTVLKASIISPLRKERRDAEDYKSCVGLCHLLHDYGHQKKEIEEEL